MKKSSTEHMAPKPLIESKETIDYLAFLKYLKISEQTRSSVDEAIRGALNNDKELNLKNKEPIIFAYFSKLSPEEVQLIKSVLRLRELPNVPPTSEWVEKLLEHYRSVWKSNSQLTLRVVKQWKHNDIFADYIEMFSMWIEQLHRVLTELSISELAKIKNAQAGDTLRTFVQNIRLYLLQISNPRALVLAPKIAQIVKMLSTKLVSRANKSWRIKS